MTQLDTIELAKQGNTSAINTLVGQWINLPSITVKAILKQDCLQIILESIKVPEQQSLVLLIHDGLIDLGIQAVKKVKIYGRETGEDFPDWQQKFELEAQTNQLLVTPQADIEVECSTSITKATADSQLAVQKPSFLGSLFGAVVGTAGAVGDAAVQAGQAVAGTAIELSGVISGAAFHATQIAGQALAIVGNNPSLQSAIESLNKDWLNPLIEQVDLPSFSATQYRYQNTKQLFYVSRNTI